VPSVAGSNDQLGVAAASSTLCNSCVCMASCDEHSAGETGCTAPLALRSVPLLKQVAAGLP
jgi:hypothetical protein